MTAPDDLRARIAARPTDPSERGRLINEAIENNMADEIPDDWAIGVGQGPDDEPLTPEVFDYISMPTLNADLAIVLSTDGTLAIETTDGSRLYLFNVDRFWQDQELSGLTTMLLWARNIDFDDLLASLGDRPIDPTNQLHAWLAEQGGPGTTIPLVVGINAQGLVDLVLGQEHYTFASRHAIDDLRKGISRLQKELEDDFS